MSIEIEARFRVDQRAIFTELLQLRKLGSFVLLPTPGIEHQRNTYFDTPNRRLAAQHYSLRVRDLGRRRIATVKRSLGAQVGVHIHEEWEVELNAGADPGEWPASEARDRALEILDGAPAVPMFMVQTRRQYIYVIQATSLAAEFSLDEGAIIAGERSVSFRELEVELLANEQPAILDDLIAELLALFPLVPQPYGKKKRGLALLEGRILGTAEGSPLALRTSERLDAVAVGW